MSDTTNKANIIAKTLFILGGIILFIVLVIFIFRMVPVAISNLKTIGSGIKDTFSGEQIKVNTESNITYSGTPFDISVEHKTKEDGTYFLEYTCKEGLFFDIQSQEGAKRIVCDVPFELGQNIKEIRLIPLLPKEVGFVDTDILFTYQNRDNVLAKGDLSLTVKNESEKNTYNATNSLSGSTVTTKTLSQTQTQSFIPGTKDLKITYITDISNSAFVMHVYNIGNTPTGPWEFSYTDAESPKNSLMSPIQPSLNGGQGLLITVGFDGQENSKQIISVQLDPSNKIQESNEINNISSVNISGGTSSGYNSKDDADLIITDMFVGKISNRKFIEDKSIDDSDTAAVKFIVKNQGGESTGSWKFKLTNTPYDTDDTYISKSYSSLKPGESMEFVVDFEDIDDGTYRISLKIDSSDSVNEEKENNNTESKTLEVNN